MKKDNKIPLFLKLGVVLFIIVIAIFVYVLTRLRPLYVIAQNGYGVGKSDIESNLKLTNFNIAEKNFSLQKINESETIYQRGFKYYIDGDSKKQINLDYPIFLDNNNLSMLNLNKNIKLITDSYESVGGYPNFILTDGIMYNESNSIRTDPNEYLFMYNSDKIYFNTKNVYIKTDLNEYKIPLDSTIYFDKSYVSYYKLNNSDHSLEYNVLQDVSLSSYVYLNGEVMTYEAFLYRIKVLEAKDVNESTVDLFEDLFDFVDDEDKKDEEEEKVTTIEEKKKESNKVVVIDNRKKKETNLATTNGILNGNAISNIDISENYVKPEVSMTDLNAKVYTATTNLSINDPAGRITKGIQITLYDENENIFNRYTASRSGTITIGGLKPNSKFKVEGSFIYRNESGKKVSQKFYNGEVRTGRIEDLDELNLSFTNGQRFADKIQINDIGFITDINSEVMNGLAKIVVEANDKTFNFSQDAITKLKKGQKVSFESEASLKSNSKIKYRFVFYDRFGNKLKAGPNEGETNTIKKEPKVELQVNTKDVVTTKIKFIETNVDNVNIKNARYVVYDQNGNLIKEESIRKFSENVILQDLDPNSVYSMEVYGDYDLEDGNGERKDVKLGESKFTTRALSSLGYVYYKTEVTDVTYKDVKFNLTLDINKTDSRLVNLIDYVEVQIVNNNNIVSTKNLTEDDILKLISGEPLELSFDKLDSNTNYIINVITKASQGKVQEQVPTDNDNNKFKTNKKPAIVYITNLFVTETIIDFDYKVDDPDNSVIGNNIILTINDYEAKSLMQTINFETNKEYTRLTLNKLEKNHKYQFSFVAPEYNETDRESQTQTNYNLLTSLNKTDSDNPFIIETVEGINGSIQLNNLIKKEQTDKDNNNLIDVSSNVKWYVYPNFGTSDWYGKTYDEVNDILTIGGHGNYRRAVYDLRDYAGQEVTMSFKAQAVNDDKTGNFGSFFIQNSRNDTNRTALVSTKGEKIDDSTWKNCAWHGKVDSTGFLGFYVQGGQGLKIKDLQVELGSFQTPYRKYKYSLRTDLKVNVTDLRNEILTDDYYIKIYKNNEEISNEDYLNLVDLDVYKEELRKMGKFINDDDGLNNYIEEYKKDPKRYIELDDTNTITDKLVRYLGLEENATYKFDLVVKRQEREYILSSQEITTTKGKEIYGIYSMDDYRLIQPFGSYIFFTDIDLRDNNYLSYGYTWDTQRTHFDGTLDFNGHTLYRNQYRNYTYGAFPQLGRNAVIKNLVLDISTDTSTEYREMEGLFYSNYGTIDNLRVNISKSNKLQDIYTLPVGDVNYGTINNFIVDIQVPYYTNVNSSAFIWVNRGTIKNGYIYGNNIISTGDAPVETGYYRNIGVLAYNNERAGNISNVYSLVNVEIEGPNTDSGHNNVSNLLLYNNATISNTYTVGESNTGSTVYGPSIWSGNGRYNENYYFIDDNKVLNNNYNKKTTKLALKDPTFQGNILNSEGEFNVDDLIKEGYYPQLKQNDCMPRQAFIPLPEIKDSDLPDVISIEVLEQGSSWVIGEFSVNNPSAEQIESISVSDNMTVEIISQQYQEGKGRSTVKAKLSNPNKFVSSYSVTSISTRGAYNTYTRNYKANERIINVDLYREINNILDWQGMRNHLDENYMLMTDLDFLNQSASTISIINNTYSGKFDGNNHTIKNIEINRGIFGRVSGQISNLNIENYTCKNPSVEIIAPIEISQKGIINNVHTNNVTIEADENKIGGSFFAGGVVGQSYDSGNKIINSSAKNVKLVSNGKINDIRIGGIAAYASNTIIQNSFVQNAEITAFNDTLSNGVGGLVGRSDPSFIDSCYAHGKILTDASRVGGISGYTSTAGTLSHTYSYVNIDSYGDYIGGISGFNITPTYNLAVGEVYARVQTGNFGRISGYNITTKNNYAYNGQPMNGSASADDGDANLLTKDLLEKSETYLQTMNWDNNFDYSVVSNGILPKLKGQNGNLLPNQDDLKIPDTDIIDLSTVRIDSKEASRAQVTAKIINPSHLELTDVEIDDMNVSILGTGLDSTDNSITNLVLKLTPKKYYDSYKLNKIVYKASDGSLKTKEVSYKIPVKFYKQLYSYDDWQSICKGDNENTYQNYMLMNDIDFAGKTDINYNVTMARLETQGTNEASRKTLKNITLEGIPQETGLIRKISVNCNNILFDNIKIYTGNNGGNYVGIIRKIEGDFENVKFTNVKIAGGTEKNEKNSSISGIGCVSQITDAFVKDISLDTIEILGSSYVGSFCGISTDLGDSITATNVKIIASGDYIGGVVGTNSSGNQVRHRNVKITNSHIKGRNHVGGIAGTSQIIWGSSVSGNVVSNGEVDSRFDMKVSGSDRWDGVYTMTVEGNYQVGGMFGCAYDTWDGQSQCNVTNVKVKGTGGRTGGYAGYTNDWWACVKTVQNSYITGTSEVGGINGYQDNQCNNQISKNNYIYGSRTNVGGISGYAWNSNNTGSYDLSQSNIISGNSNVGGIYGGSGSARIYNSLSANNTITATLSNAGGIIGYLDNNGMTGATKISSIIGAMCERTTINCASNGGGIAGYITTQLYNPNTFFKNNYTEVIVNGNSQGSISAFVGSNRARNLEFVKTYAFNGCSLNGRKVSTNVDNITKAMLLTAAELKLPATYINKIGIDSGWSRNDPSSGYYPRIGSTALWYETRVTLPEDTSSVNAIAPAKGNKLMSNMKFMRNVKLAQTSSKDNLPTINVYPSDVDKINIDFSNVDKSAEVNIISDDKTYNIGEAGNKTITLKYDFNKDFKINITKDNMVKTYDYTNKNLAKSISLYNDKKAYVVNNNLYINGAIEKSNIKNIYEGKALNENGEIIDLNSLQTLEKMNEEDEFKKINTKPLETYILDDVNIERYGTYSLVDGELRNDLYYVRDNKLSILSGELDMKIDNAIVDYVNSKEYQVVLDTGMLVNIKEDLKYPNTILNSDIKELTTNTNKDIKQAMIIYENGKVLTFDYSTGEKESEYEVEGEEKEKISLGDYIKSKFKETLTLAAESDKDYLQSVNVISKLKKKSIDDLEESDGNSEIVDNIEITNNLANTVSDNENETNSTAENKDENTNITNTSNAANNATTSVANNNSNSNKNSSTKKANSNSNSNSSYRNYVSVYNAKSKKYEIYDQNKLLDKDLKQDDIESETSKIESSTVLEKYYYSSSNEIESSDANSVSRGKIIIGIIIGSVVLILIILNRRNKKFSKR